MKWNQPAKMYLPPIFIFVYQGWFYKSIEKKEKEKKKKLRPYGRERFKRKRKKDLGLYVAERL